jgi:hypothetical protein
MDQDKNNNVGFEVLIIVIMKSMVTTDFWLLLLFDPEDGGDMFL